METYIFSLFTIHNSLNYKQKQYQKIKAFVYVVIDFTPSWLWVFYNHLDTGYRVKNIHYRRFNSNV